jgi:hypothetical protein
LVRVVEGGFGDRKTDGVVLADDFREPDRCINGIKLAIDVDLSQLADEDYRRVAILGGVPRGDPDRQPLVGSIAKPFLIVRASCRFCCTLAA